MIFIPPLGLYIHIPWCFKKCPFCDLNSYKKIHNKLKNIYYINHIIQDLKNNLHMIKNRIIKTIFIGGGTPNLLHYTLIKKLIYQIKKIIYIDIKTEITIEINPDYITINEILEYIQCGINRISIGVQSFNNIHLKSLGRKNIEHNTLNILHKIKKYNINFNIDIMYGLPNQSLKSCLNDLKKTILIQPNHISWYQLNIEKNTIFYYKKLNTPKENTIMKMYTIGNNILRKQYIQYEISSYSHKKYLCKHNLNYWTYGDYLGIGCGSHSKITTLNGNIIRIIKKKRIYEYMNNKHQYIEKIYTIHNQEKPFEYFINNFRLFNIIQKKKFNLYTGLKIQNIKKIIKKCIQKKYIIENNHTIQILPHGRNFLNNLIKLFIL